MALANISIIIGVIALTVGVLLLTTPNFLKRLNELSIKVISKIDEHAFTYRIGFGVSLIIIAIFMFFMAYYFQKRLK
ncbi:MAG: hypothetical protein HZC12_07665 [Nitrospirae bacterium]|nr:hypothetical protein [Nitrospirota bacterium]